MKDPLWKLILNWGAVITFLVLPVLLLSLQMSGWLTVDKEELDYLREYFRNITILVFGLAGLRTWEAIKANGRPGPEPLKDVHTPRTIENETMKGT